MPKSMLKVLVYLKKKYGHIYDRLLPSKVRTRIWRCVEVTEGLLAKPDEEAIAFYTQHSKRVETVASWFADERSKDEYLGMVKFRQSQRRKDYPRCNLKTPEYFIGEMTLDKDEVFVDCGAYIGDTIDLFVERCPTYKRIIAFEPDEVNFVQLKQKHGNNPRMTIFNDGVYDFNGNVHFSAQQGGGMSSAISDAAADTVTIAVKTIDSLNLNDVSFIKMDIEGAELKALKGAEKTILRDKPKLAICIYHSKEDMINIAEYIHALVPEYHLYVRHHSRWPGYISTVLYARMP